MGRKVAWIFAILVLLSTGAAGFFNGVNEISQAETPLQHSVTIGVFLYGIFGITGAVALIARHRSAVKLTWAWAMVVTYVASVAALAYAGDEATVGGAIAGGVGAAIIGVGIVWCARFATRPASLHERVHPTAEAPR
jgi:hypothetical protein